MNSINEIFAKSIITKSKLPNVDYCLNIYVGCQHDCKYCYASFMKKFTKHLNDDWGTFVDYKINAIDLLKKKIKKIDKSKQIILGSMTDSYQPIEKKLELTRKCLEILQENHSNVSILTKSNLILRDIDILSKMNNLEVGLSYGISDINMKNELEPYSSSVEKRLEALNTLKQNKIKTYVMIAPIIPFFTDLKLIFNDIKDKVDFVIGEILNTRCLNNNFKNSLLKIVGPDKYKEIIDLCNNKLYINKVKCEYENLCAKYFIENHGFFSHCV